MTRISKKICWDAKDPDERLDYQVDWLGSRFKPGELYGLSDTISNSLWIVPAGITSEAETLDPAGVSTIWLSGGTDGDTYEIVNRITTAAGRVFDRTVELPVKTK